MGKMVRRSLLALLAVCGAGALALAVGVVVPVRGATVAGGPGGTTRVLLVANAIHTDFVLPATPALRERFGFLERDGLPLDWSEVRNLVVGWGAREFYVETPTWADLKVWPAARALTVDASVMHVALAGPFDPAAPGISCVDLGPDAYERLLSSIEARFQRSDDGTPVVIEGAGYTDYDRFYEAVGWFNVLLGCNTFTAATLRAAGVTTGLWTPLPATLFLSLDLHGASAC